MAWQDQRFSDQYSAAKKALAKSDTYDAEWKKSVEALHKLMDDTGFEPGRAGELDDLRKKVTRGESKGFARGHAKVSVDEGILRAAKGWSDKPTATLDAATRQRAAALKFLQHVYLLRKRGSHKVWIHSLPNDFGQWSFEALGTGTIDAVKQLLKSDKERFSAEQKKHLSNATQDGLKWCQKTLMVLSAAAGSGKGKDKSLEIIKRWFAEAGTTDKELSKIIATLTAGFKTITATINRGQIVFTDFPALRGATTAEEQGLLSSEAFVWGLSGREKLDVVYIENEFFGTKNVLSGQTNWTRIVIHELSHLVCGTTDVEPGPRYSWYGIGPNPNFPGTDAVKNADSWAFFAADCGGALSDSDRKKALRIR